MEEKNSLIIMPKELEVLSSTLLNKTDSSIYETLDQIYSLMDKTPYIEEYIMSSRSSETEKSIEELILDSKLVSQQLTSFLEHLEKKLPKERVMKKNWSSLDRTIRHIYRDDAFFGLILAEEIKNFIEIAIDNKFLDIQDELLVGVFKSNNQHLEWKWSDIRYYLEQLYRLQRKEHSKPWYNHMYLKHFYCLRCNISFEREFPVSAPELASLYLDLMKTEKDPVYTFGKYSIEEIKSSWAIISSYLKSSDTLSKLETIISFDPESGGYQLTNGTKGIFSKKKTPYKILKYFSDGNLSFNFTTILSYDNCDIRNDIAKYLRKKLKLTTSQLINKDGFLSLVGVKIIKI